MGEVVLCVDGTNVRGENFLQSNLHVRVFNRDFIRENVFPVVGHGDMPPILVLGAENVEKQKKVGFLKERGIKAQSDLESARTRERTALGEFDQFCIDRARVIKDTLRSSGENPYNNYNKTNFQNDAQTMVEAGDRSIHLLDEADRQTLLVQRQATPKKNVEELAYALPEFNVITDCLTELLATTVVSAAIETLKGDPVLSAWTRKGLALHRDRNTERCQFCEQPLPTERLAALEGHFSTQYENFVQRIDEEIETIKTLDVSSTDLPWPTRTALYDDLGPEYESAEAKLAKAIESARGFLEAAVQALEDKKRCVFEHVNLDVATPEVDAGAVDKLNEVIRKHNQACNEFEARVEEARKRLADDMIAVKLEEFERRRDSAACAKANLQEKSQDVVRLYGEIAKLESEIVEHRRPAEELNEDLQKYLGHRELCLEIRETGYTITRSGVPAESLSEGESTAIALLYFLKSLQDRRFELENGAIVLDDPVSSLDANALFLAFGFIRERTEGAGQLFVLTHNFSFFRQIRNWFHHINGRKKRNVTQRPARFFMLDSTLDGNERSSVIRWLDPLLKEYESEYQYLFAQVHRASTVSASQDLEQNYVLPNVARRMLEAFLAFRRPRTSGDLWQKLKAVPFDESKKLRILRFLHTHSHSIAVGEPEHDLTALAEGPSVLKNLMEMIESLDNEHYSDMVRLVALPTDSEHDVGEAVTT